MKIYNALSVITAKTQLSPLTQRKHLSFTASPNSIHLPQQCASSKRLFRKLNGSAENTASPHNSLNPIVLYLWLFLSDWRGYQAHNTQTAIVYTFRVSHNSQLRKQCISTYNNKMPNSCIYFLFISAITAVTVFSHSFTSACASQEHAKIHRV